jgi:hypothetical protein
MASYTALGRSPWGWARAVLLLGAGALTYAGCSVDDRVLTNDGRGAAGGAGAGGAVDCSAQPVNTCEACLYASCCDEAEACGEGSACAVYFRCADACAGDVACENQCAASSPAGFGDAVALGVCSQTNCEACTGRQAAAVESCDPSGGGACQSEADCATLGAGALEDIDTVACAACDIDLLAPACAECLSGQTGLSEPCSACFAEWLACAVESCLSACDAGGDPVTCQSCLADRGCNTRLGSCGFSG